MPIRVAIVEDTESFRESLAALLNLSPDFACVAKFSNAEDAINRLLDSKPDVALMDIGLPKMSGIQALKALKAIAPDVQYLMLTIIEDDEKIFDALQAGASGYLLKSTPPEKILEAIRDVKNGGSAMSASVARRVIAFFQQRPKPQELFNLSDREWEILQLLAKGYTKKEIGEKLPQKISEHTVRTHVYNIYRKLHVNNSAEAIAKVSAASR
ncbi:MAG: response regulator transcription factor [Chloroherpetonaceae bacterium]|nr:response regulator transcription factor [Chloroherpetonaceae bacterium]MDW8437272.1 response regulator transcription factor [Chloroherpetonaceae bacterium]